MPRSHRRNGAPPRRAARSVTARIHYLIEWLRSGRRLTTPLAADALGVSRRTISRDMAQLRDTYGLAIAYDLAQETYTLEHHHATLPFIPHPNLLPAILSGVVEPGFGERLRPGTIQVRLSPHCVRIYESISGADLSRDIDTEGWVAMRFAFPNLEDAVRWVLSCGAEVEVLGPPEFRAHVGMEIRRMRHIYEDDGTDAA